MHGALRARDRADLSSRDEAALVLQQVPPTPQAPPAPPVQGVPADVRREIADAIRNAREAAEQARAQAREAQQQVQVDVNGERIVVSPGGTGAGGTVGQPGTIIYPGPPPGPFDQVPPQVFDLVFAFFMMIAFIAVGTPLARAFGRRMDRRPVQVAANPELTSQLQRIEHAVEAMAIEVERISEAQRYMARLESERGADPLLARPARPPR